MILFLTCNSRFSHDNINFEMVSFIYKLSLQHLKSKNNINKCNVSLFKLAIICESFKLFALQLYKINNFGCGINKFVCKHHYMNYDNQQQKFFKIVLNTFLLFMNEKFVQKIMFSIHTVNIIVCLNMFSSQTVKSNDWSQLMIGKKQ